jgi:hypothetical protein
LLHNLTKNNIIDKYKQIIGVLKQDELLESLIKDNQQPSLDSNIFEGSTTNSRVLTHNGEDSNANTSVLLNKILKIIDDDIV